MPPVMLCHEMRWTYDEYLDNPQWFLELLQLKMELDTDFKEKEAKKAQRRTLNGSK